MLVVGRKIFWIVGDLRSKGMRGVPMLPEAEVAKMFAMTALDRLKRIGKSTELLT